MPLRPNQRLQLHYPSTTIIGRHPEFQARQLITRSIRDLVSDPLTIEEYFRRPFTTRGRWLVRAYDLEQSCTRQFYLANSREYSTQSPLRIGIYEPGHPRPLEVVSRGFGNTRRERILLARTLKRFLEFELLSHVFVRIFADDLNVG